MHTFLLSLLGLVLISPLTDPTPKGKVVREHINSVVLQNTKTGLDPQRSISIYLPPGYDASDKSYPVIYYFHGLFWDNERMFEDGVVQKIFDEAIAAGTIDPFILVAPNYSTPTVGSFFENSSTSGRWIDFTMEEMIPFVESRYRILQNRDSRGITGELMGGYGAFKLA
ncbi:MAG: alpha/beta hydrolase-fold protein, partial [Bacteroidota bacterium]